MRLTRPGSAEEAYELVAAAWLAGGRKVKPTLNAFRRALETVSASPSAVAMAAKLLLALPDLLQQGPAMLVRGRAGQVTLSRRQCGALLAAALFGAIPNTGMQAQSTLILPTFDLLFVLDADKPKAQCIVNYFALLGDADEEFLNEVVTFSRRSEEHRQLMTSSFWKGLDKPLVSLSVVEGAIENATGLLQADFANEYLGGGALHGGNVQEEIRFAVCPECFVGMLFCEVMEPNEAIFIVGTLQYSLYAGYGSGFKFAGAANLKEIHTEPADSLGRRGPHIVAFDALCFPGDLQYQEGLILRELVKAYVACLGDISEDAGPRCSAIATGNWGCGVFGGDPQLKALIQWLAASAADRNVVYYPFGDKRVAELERVVAAVQSHGMRCSGLFELLQSHEPRRVFDGVLERLSQHD